MDYEKKYTEAIERAKSKIKNNKDHVLYEEDIINIFPELKESKDEKIRKKLLSSFKGIMADADEDELWYGLPYNDIIAWLEKQGNPKSIWHNEDEEPQRGSLILLIMESGTPIVAKIIEPNHTFNHGERWAYIDDLLEKQGEPNFEQCIQEGDKIVTNKDGTHFNVSQLERVAKPVEEYNITGISSKHAKGKLGEMIKNLNAVNEVLEQKPANKVEPKFNVGDWVINTITNNVEQIIKITSSNYICSGTLIVSFDNQHLLKNWTIQDAKNGDILVGSERGVILMFRGIGNTRWSDVIDYHCYYDCRRKDFIVQKGVEYWGNTKDNQLNPATKEQRDLLFQKMKESGYEWNDKNKKLKKINIITPLFNVGDTIIKKHNSDINKFGKFTITAIIDNKYWYRDKIICDITEQDEWELIKQSTAVWSEDDETKLKSACAFIRNTSLNGNEDVVNSTIDWLKSLKERMRGE